MFANLLTGLIIATVLPSVKMENSLEKSVDSIEAVPFYEVNVNDRFWSNRIELMNTVSVPYALEHGKPAINRLRQCADYRRGISKELPFRHRFISSDLYKTLEAAAYSLEYDRNAETEALMDSIITIIGNAQLDDGYLYVDHICKNPNIEEEGPLPYSKHLASHEIYNVGHLYEAAVAYYHATGKDNLLKIAEKSAHHINRVVFEGDPNYLNGKPLMMATGHEEVEIALCKLYKVTGNRLYLDMARKFLDIRGVTYKGDQYGQHHLPVREQRTAVGHAVRAGYLYYSMALVDYLSHTEEYSQALHAIWKNIVDRKMHITGGLGAVHTTEGFGDDYDLPNKNAYNETCAAVANVFFNYQLFLNEGKAEYLDIMETALFNCALSGISVDGNRFYYQNPLECDGIRCFISGGNKREQWFDCACCPPNILRLILQTPGYMYAHTSDAVYTTLYASSKVNVDLKEGLVNIVQQSDYPWNGTIRLKINPINKKQRFKLYMRIPTWARTNQFLPGNLYTFADGKHPNFKLMVNGSPVSYQLKDGFAVVDRSWKRGDQVELDLPIIPRYVSCNSRVKDNHHRLSVTRGPLVYCAEKVDNPVERAQEIFLGQDYQELKTYKLKNGVLKGLIALTGQSHKVVSGKQSKTITLSLIPYFLWSNRMPGNTMVVWIPKDEQTARKSIPGNGYLDNVKSVSVTTCSHQYPAKSLCDGGVGSASKENTTPFWSSVGLEQKEQEAVITFKHPKELTGVGVYWTDRSEGTDRFINCGINKVPANWRLVYKVNGQWKPFKLYITDSYGTRINQFNMVRPTTPVKCEAVKIIMMPNKGYTVGISEVQFTFKDE